MPGNISLIGFTVSIIAGEKVIGRYSKQLCILHCTQIVVYFRKHDFAPWWPNDIHEDVTD